MKKPKLKFSEKDAQNSIVAWLTAKRMFFYRQNTGANVTTYKRVDGSSGRYFTKFGCPGSPDIVLICAGIYVGIECKSSSGRQSPAQKDFQDRLEKVGGVYILARSIDDVQKRLKDEGFI
jgi:hypothetical protein